MPWCNFLQWSNDSFSSIQLFVRCYFSMMGGRKWYEGMEAGSILTSEVHPFYWWLLTLGCWLSVNIVLIVHKLIVKIKLVNTCWVFKRSSYWYCKIYFLCRIDIVLNDSFLNDILPWYYRRPPTFCCYVVSAKLFFFSDMRVTLSVGTLKQ